MLVMHTWELGIDYEIIVGFIVHQSPVALVALIDLESALVARLDSIRASSGIE